MTALRHLRFIAFVEGLSFLVLLFIAMPLKYWAGMPQAVRVVGLVHGVLFLLFSVALLRVATDRSWSLWRSVWAFGSSLVPFGTFVLDRALKQEISAAAGEVVLQESEAGR